VDYSYYFRRDFKSQFEDILKPASGADHEFIRFVHRNASPIQQDAGAKTTVLQLEVLCKDSKYLLDIHMLHHHEPSKGDS